MGRGTIVSQTICENKENVDFSFQGEHGASDVSSNSPISIGRKRPFECIESNISDEENLDIKKLKKYIDQLEERIGNLEKTAVSFREHNSDHNLQLVSNSVMNLDSESFIPIHTVDHHVINDIVDNIVLDNSSNHRGIGSSGDNVALIDRDETGNTIVALEMNGSQLDGLKQSNATATARNIMRYLYPNPDINFKLSNIDKLVVDEIIDYVQKLHPAETTARSKIKSAMSNYFGLNAFRKKKTTNVSTKTKRIKMEIRKD